MASTRRAPRDRAAPVDDHAARRINGNSSNGLERERVNDIQRARMLGAMAEVASKRGASNVTVGHVVESAGVSRRTFYELFDDSEDCLLEAFDHALASVSERALPAFRAGGAWRQRMRAGLHALLAFLDEEPYLGRLLIVESLGTGRMLERRSRVVATLVAAVDGGRKQAKKASPATQLTAEGVVGAVLSVIHGRMLDRKRKPLVELLNPLMSMVVMPYLGASAARRELAQPAIKASPLVATVPASPLRGLGMRLTYRTVRVLAAIAATPGSSNRRIGDAAGMSDQGQISKLLARLEKLQLVENTGAGHARGEPNAWALTPRGEEVNGAIVKRGHA